MAVVHMVLVQWRPDLSDTALSVARIAARRMESRISGIVRLEEGPSVSPEGLEQEHNYGLLVEFESGAARDAYLPHPAHLEFGEHIKAGAIKVTVFDLAV